MHRFRLGWAQTSEKINVRWMHSQRTAQDQILEQDAGHGDSELSRVGTRGPRSDVVVERRR